MISVILIVSLVGFSFCETTGNQAESKENLTVRYAAVIFRHGDRTPVDVYPTDPYKNESLWPVPFGQLTNTGKKQHYALGQWLRQRYSHLLSKDYKPNEIRVKSTDVDRTLMSVEANLAGLYPPQGTSVWNDNIKWQPVPVHTAPEKSDQVLAMKRPCPAYDRAWERLIESKEYKERLNRYQSLMDYLTAYTGRKIKDYEDIVYIYSTLYIETLYNFTLPNWTHSVYPDKMKEPACYSFKTATMTPLMARLKAGPLIQEIVMHMANKSLVKDSTQTLTFSIYSGHDFTIGNVLNALGLYDGNCPVYTSTIIFELLFSETKKTHFVRILYRNFTDIREPYVLNIPYCGEICDFNRFVYLYEKLLDINWDFECSREFPPVIGISLLFGVGVVAAIYVAHRILFVRTFQRKRYNIPYSNLHSDKISDKLTEG